MEHFNLIRVELKGGQVGVEIIFGERCAPPPACHELWEYLWRKENKVGW